MDAKMRRKLVGVVAVVAVVAIIASTVNFGILLRADEFPPDGVSTSPAVRCEWTYYPANESLRLTNAGEDTITRAEVTGPKDEVLFVVVRFPAYEHTNETRAEIRSAGRVSPDGVWADDTDEALQNRSMNGDSVIVSDETDRDGDGQTGIEPDERVILRWTGTQPDGIIGTKRHTATLCARTV